MKLITAGLDAYHQVSLQTMEELPALSASGTEFILAGLPVDQEKLAANSRRTDGFSLKPAIIQRAMRPEVPGVLEAIQKMGLKIGLISNVNSRGQVPANLKRYGIRQYFRPAGIIQRIWPPQTRPGHFPLRGPPGKCSHQRMPVYRRPDRPGYRSEPAGQGSVWRFRSSMISNMARKMRAPGRMPSSPI